MLLFACGDKTETVLTEGTNVTTTENTGSNKNEVKVSEEASKTKVDQVNTGTTGTTEVAETKVDQANTGTQTTDKVTETTDQTVTNQEQNTEME